MSSAQNNYRLSTPAGRHESLETKQDVSCGLVRVVLQSEALLPIDFQRSAAVGSAKAFLAEVLALEQRCELVIANLLKLEQTFNSTAADAMLRHNLGDASWQDLVLLENQSA